MTKSKGTVVVGMSGGVDSAAAALLMHNQGYNVLGATLRLQSLETEAAGNAPRDAADAKAVCDALGIPHFVVDWRENFRRMVLDYFADSYAAGQTPNPCVICNRRVKFPALFSLANEQNADFVATGHYAHTLFDTQLNRWRLKKADNRQKDQSYVLFSLSQSELSRTLFPLGGYAKDDIRKLAENAGLNIARKGDSQDICFIPDGDYAAFLCRYTGMDDRPGDFVDDSGNVLGRHKGIRRYTIGQRKGLGLSFSRPMFVRQIDPEANTVMLGDNESLKSRSLIAGNVNWIDLDELHMPLRLDAQIRYAHKPTPATVSPLEGGRVLVAFDEPQRAIAKGQAVVFSSGDFVAGGGIIAG